jgi:hypothetical protein
VAAPENSTLGEGILDYLGYFKGAKQLFYYRIFAQLLIIFLGKDRIG